MVSAAEILVLIGILTVVGAILSRAAKSLRKPVAFIAGSLIVVGTLFGGLAWAGVPAFIDIPGISPPVATGLWSVQFLATSSVDRTTSGENIVDGGHTIRYELTDANMDGLGDVNLDIRVINQNVGASTDVWPFEVVLTYVSTTTGATPAAQPIVNRTNTGSIDERAAVTYSLTESGSPTLTQLGERAVSNDWATGLSDQLNVDFEMSVVACDDIAVGTPGKLQFTVGGVLMTVELTESA